MLHRITVKGCQYGFQIAQAMCGQLIEHIRLVNIGTCGVTTDSNGLSIRGLVAENMKVPVAEIITGTAMNHFPGPTTPPAPGRPGCLPGQFYGNSGWIHSAGAAPGTGPMDFYQSSTMGYLMIVDAVLQGVGAASGLTAIRNQASGGKMFLRNITETGYARTAQELGGGGPAGHNIVEYASTPKHNLWQQTPTSLNIPIVNTPEKPWSILSQWTNWDATPGVTVTHGTGETTGTTYTALQQGIDNCTTDTLYFPSSRDGRVRMVGSGTLVVRGQVKHIVGNGMEFRATADGQTMTLRFEHPTRPVGSTTVTWEDFAMNQSNNLNINAVVATPRDVVIMDVQIGSITNTPAATGTLFIEDIINGQINFANAQDVFARQHNADGSHVIGQYSGGDYVCLYLKSEPHGDPSELPVNWSGRIEILGGFIANPAGGTTAIPIWRCNNAGPINPNSNHLSVAGFASSLGGLSGQFSVYATEVQNGVTRSLVPAGSSPGGLGVPALAPRFNHHHMTLYRSKIT